MTSIVKKIGLKPGMRALVLGAPSGYMNSFAPLPEQVEVSHTLGSAHEFVQFFATKKSEIAKSAKKLLQSGPLRVPLSGLRTRRRPPEWIAI